VITGAAEVDVTGTLLGGIVASGTGDVRIANSGSIGGGIAVGTTAGSFVLINGGTVMGDITAGASTDRISGSGLITGDIALGAGADVFAGRVLGDLDMGLGDDRVEARGGAVQGVIHDAGGNDLYRIDGAVEIHDLGTGRDTVEAWSDTALAPGLEVLILKGAGDLVGTGNALANRISGTVGDNLLRGEAGADQIYGGLGADTLRGGAGADRLFGGADEDRLNGGAGADLLTGGTGADLFVFGPGSGIGDEIRDFDSLDRIDLRAYGALHVVSALDGTSAQVAISIAGGMTHLAIDADGDGLAEASVALWGAPLLTSDDLLMV
jgi:Ca2+-binding RTX toxin-like protein